MEIARREVDQLDLMGAIEETIRHRFADGSAGDGGDDIRTAFEVLDVDGGEDIDPGIEQLRDILPAFRMA
ncbi:hypothetical protein D3C72_2452080 [compost metagenome]